MKPILTLLIALWFGKEMCGRKWETSSSIFCRTSFCRFFLSALLLPAVPSAYADLVAHYRFDGDLKDATGRHDGRPVDAKLAPVFAPGRIGSAVVIERANAGIEAANPAAIALVAPGFREGNCPFLVEKRGMAPIWTIGACSLFFPEDRR